MSRENCSLSSGLKHLPVFMDDIDTGRTVDFNPADQGFAESLYCLVSKISSIHDAKMKEYEAAKDAVQKFDIGRAEDAEMRASVDSLFGEGFCKDVFKTRLFALVDGVTVIEGFLLSILDEMDDTITDNIAKRDAKIKKYTDKYSKYKKYHN